MIINDSVKDFESCVSFWKEMDRVDIHTGVVSYEFTSGREVYTFPSGVRVMVGNGFTEFEGIDFPFPKTWGEQVIMGEYFPIAHLY